VPLNCLRCATPIPAQPGEIGWVCRHCGLPQRLHPDEALVEMPMHYAAGIPDGQRGRPFWAAEAQVGLNRQTYQALFGVKSGEAEKFWGRSRRIFVPAYTAGLDETIETGTALLRHPPQLAEGAAVAFRPITVRPEDVRQLVDFIVLAIEAERSDDLKSVSFQVQLGEPVCWVLP
jgi:hypothetical protein